MCHRAWPAWLKLTVVATFVAATGAGAMSVTLARAARHVRHARAGDVVAQLSYVKEKHGFGDVRVKISRAGLTLVDRRVSPPCKGCGTWPGAGYAGHPPILVRDLDGDSEPEVIVDLYTGGVHCCSWSRIYRFDPSRGRYRQLDHRWGNQTYRLADLRGDGALEFRSRDDRFAYAFTCFTCSEFPLRIWRYRRAAFVNVTRSYPRLVAADGRRLWHKYLRVRKGRFGDVKGILAAYLADRYLLGQEREGWRHLLRAYHKGNLGRRYEGEFCPCGHGYLVELRRFLRDDGYVR